MQNLIRSLLFFSAFAFTSSVYAVESDTFFGVDIVDQESDLDYANGSETYEYTSLRVRYGVESREGASAGFEFIAPADDETTDPFGQDFELEAGPTLGAYFTIGTPVYIRLGISVTEIEYTHVASGTSDDDVITSLDLGLGFNYSLNPQLTIYGELNRRDAGEVELDTFFTGDVDLATDSFSIGFNYLF